MTTSAEPRPSEQRVSILTGDRLCTHCGYNLTGQSIVREPHYNLLIVRCPECSAAASVQEYPLLGRWANRWAALLGAIWFLLLVFLWVGSGAALFGLCLGSAEIAMERYNSRIWHEFSQHQLALQQQNPGNPNAAYSPTTFDTWWKAIGPSFMQGQFGTWAKAINWDFLYLWIPLALVAFVLGCFWATALLALNRRRLMIVGCAVMFVAITFSAIVIIEWFGRDTNYWNANSGREIGTPVLLASLVCAAVILTTGLLVGRSTVRMGLRILLPPQLCHTLSILWVRDGLEPPRRRS